MTKSYNITKDDVQTIISDTGELGIKIGDQCFFFCTKHGFFELSKDEYPDSVHDTHGYYLYYKFAATVEIDDPFPLYSEDTGEEEYAKEVKQWRQARSILKLPKDVDIIDTFLHGYRNYIPASMEIEIRRLCEKGLRKPTALKAMYPQYIGGSAPPGNEVLYFLYTEEDDGTTKRFEWVSAEDVSTWIEV